MSNSPTYTAIALYRDCNPGPVFSIPGFGIEKFLIPAGLRSWPLPEGILANSTKLDETKSGAQDLTIKTDSETMIFFILKSISVIKSP